MYLFSEEADEEPEHIPSLVYDPRESAANQQMEIPLNSGSSSRTRTPVKIIEEPVMTSSKLVNGSANPVIITESFLIDDNSRSPDGYDKTMQDILLSQRTQNNFPKSGASSYDLCLWCNKLVASAKTKEHALSKHRALAFHESFTCPFCQGTFNSNTTVADHLRYLPLCTKKDMLDQPITCVLCLDDFVGAGTLREHYLIFHSIGITNDERVDRRAFWSCLYCGIAEHSRMGLCKHIKTYHDTNQPHFCRFCGIKYSTLLNMHKHLIIQHRVSLGDTLHDYYALVNDLNFKLDTTKSMTNMWCMYCDEEIATEAAFNAHVKEVHYCNARKAYLCAFCNQTFKDTDSLEKHVLNGHLLGGLGFNVLKVPPKSPPLTVSSSEEASQLVVGEDGLAKNVIFYLCPICSNTAQGKDHFTESHSTDEILTNVAKLIHRNPEWMVSADCSIVRDMISTFMVPANSGVKNGLVTCTICQNTMANKRLFYYHFMENHCSSHRIQCTVCHKLYKDQTTLDLHMLRAHSKRKPARQQLIAPKKYIIKSMQEYKKPNKSTVELIVPELDKVVDITSPTHVTAKIVDIPDPAKPKILEIKPKEVLKMSCTLCDYKCVRMDHLEEHIQAKHYKKTVNQCTMCNSRYSRKRDLRRHYINKHKMSQPAARELSEMTAPEEPWRERLGNKRQRVSRKFLDNKEPIEGEVMDITEQNDSSNDNLCVINPDILDISLVGNLDKD